MTYLTIRQVGIWKNSMVLWNYVIEREPRTYFATITGATLLPWENDEAIEYRKALAFIWSILKATTISDWLTMRKACRIWQSGIPDRS
jgi:hypothetical protein